MKSHSKDPYGTKTLVILWSSKPGIRRTSEGDLVLPGGNLDRSDLVKDQVSGGIAREKDDGRIEDQQEERHLICCRSVVHHRKPFDVGIQKQPVRVLVELHKLYRY